MAVLKNEIRSKISLTSGNRTIFNVKIIVIWEIQLYVKSEQS